MYAACDGHGACGADAGLHGWQTVLKAGIWLVFTARPALDGCRTVLEYPERGAFNPPRYASGSVMPPFVNLSDRQLLALAAFLQNQRGQKEK